MTKIARHEVQLSINYIHFEIDFSQAKVNAWNWLAGLPFLLCYWLFKTMRLQTQNSAIHFVITVWGTNQNVGITTDFKVDITNCMILLFCAFPIAVHTDGGSKFKMTGGKNTGHLIRTERKMLLDKKHKINHISLTLKSEIRTRTNLNKSK